MKTIILFLLSVSVARANPHVPFVDRYDQYDEPCESEFDAYRECRYNTKSYFPVCWEMSLSSKSPMSDKKAVDCLLERASALRSKDPLKYRPRADDPKTPSRIKAYKRTRAYRARLKALKADLDYFSYLPFCLHSHVRTTQDKGVVYFKLNGIKFDNTPNNTLKVSHNVNPSKVTYLSFTLPKRGSIKLQSIGFCRGKRCEAEVYLSEEGEAMP